MRRRAFKRPPPQQPRPQPRVELDREIGLPRRNSEKKEDGEPEEETPRGVAVVNFYL